MRKMGGLPGSRQAARRARAGGAGGAGGRQARSPRLEGIINSMTPAGARRARAHQGVAQAPHRRRRRRHGAGSQPAAQPVRADAEDDEDGGQGRHEEDDARHEGAGCVAGGAVAVPVDRPWRADPRLSLVRSAPTLPFRSSYQRISRIHHGRDPACPRRRQEAPVLQHRRRRLAQPRATAGSSSASASTTRSPAKARKAFACRRADRLLDGKGAQLSDTVAMVLVKRVAARGGSLNRRHAVTSS